MLTIVEQWRINVLESDISGIHKMMIAEGSNFPDLANVYLEKVIKRTRHFVASMIELGIERNEFIKCDSQNAARSFLTPMVFSAIWQNSLAPFDDDVDLNEYLKLSMDIFMRGILNDNQG